MRTSFICNPPKNIEYDRTVFPGWSDDGPIISGQRILNGKAVLSSVASLAVR